MSNKPLPGEAHEAQPVQAIEEDLPLIPGTETARSLGEFIRDARQEQVPEEHSQQVRKQRGKSTSRSRARRYARERALQALYQWELSAAQSSDVKAEFLSGQDMSRVDVDYFVELFSSISHRPDDVDEPMETCLDRPLADLDPVERAVLRIAVYELTQRPDIPARVIINESIEITKRFGADKGHRYVNGVLDKLAARLRASEMTPR